jgi:cytochrome c oxidase subunit 1
MFNYNDSLDIFKQIFFYMLFIGVNLVFFPIHELGIDGMPRRYFAYVDRLTLINILTAFGVLFTSLSWFSLIFILIARYGYSISRYSLGLTGDSAYGNILPLHTYMEGTHNLRLHTQNLLEGS